MEMNNFDEILEPRFNNEPIKVQCIVTGKSLSPYHIPKVVEVQCITKFTGEECLGCQYQKEQYFQIEAENENILRFIDIPTTKIGPIIKLVAGIRCKNITYKIMETQSIERIFIARPTGKERTRKGGQSRQAYLLGAFVESNSVYDLGGYTTNEPTTQVVTHVFTTIEKKTNDAESFNLSLKKHSELNAFCVNKDDTFTMFTKLTKLYTNYAHNITNIYDREDLHMCVDLLFRSVISFRFGNEFVHKGWMEAMIVGDTRCGKGFVAEKMMEYFGLGEVVNGENCSFSGLVGGLQQLNKHWIITWGKIPMNDCGILTIDESGGMQEDMWGKLSRIRSEGVAEITKIQTATSDARTRLLWLCNPPNRMMSSYTYGIQALNDLVKAPEDIARFDYVLAVSHNEVDGETINKRRDPLPKIYEQQLEQDLILWCWSRKPSEVKFEEDAIKYIYESSMLVENLYDFSIPLIQVENVRYKLAKLAIAFAARFYSNEQNGKILLVKRSHVECVIVFLNKIYAKEASGYTAYSEMKKSQGEIVTPEKLTMVTGYFNKWTNKSELLRFLMNNNTFDGNGIMDHMGCVKSEATEVISRLSQASCIAKRGAYYVKAPAFVSYLKSELKLKVINKISVKENK
jgi:hypothetical protein